MKTVYLGGAINGKTDAQCKVWREQAKAFFAGRLIVIDPLEENDFRGREDGNSAVIVGGDEDRIHRSDFLLVNAHEPSWGTAMEVRIAWQTYKGVAIFCDHPHPSPWLLYHASKMFRTQQEAMSWILEASNP